MKFRCTRSGLLSLALLTSSAFADVQFNFLDGGGLDGVGIGGSMMEKDDNLIDITLTTVDIRGQDGTLASDGAGHVMNSLPPGNVGDALGINSVVNSGGWGSDDRDFNPGEEWMFSFDVDVELKALDFAGWGDNSSEVTLSFSDASAPLVLFGAPFGDTFSLGSRSVPAGTVITMALTNTSGDREVRAKYLTVAAIPEPPTGIVYGDQDGVGDWTTPDSDFLENGLPTVFNTGDDVIFPDNGNLAVTIEPAGVIAGDLAWANTRNGTLTFISGGSLVAESMYNVDRGSVRFENTATINGVVKCLENGEIEVGPTGNLTLGTLELGGGSRLEVETGGVFNGLSASIIMGGGGADIRNAEDLSLGPVDNVFDENPLEKSGAGDLELTSGLGTIATGPVTLEILEGSVTLSGTQRINIGGACVFDGNLIMNGPELELHASTITGDGSIVVDALSLMSPRFDDGDNEIQVPIVINETLVVDSASGNNALIIERNMSGPGGLIKQGNGPLEIDQFLESGTKTSYEGDTQIEAGTMRFFDPILSDTGRVIFTPYVSGTRGKLDLFHGQSDVVNALYIDGVQMPSGTYGSSSVTGAVLDVVDDDRFMGDGWLVVLSDASSPDYQSWASGFGLEGLPHDDDDLDGVSNGDEYAFGTDPTVASSLSPISESLDAATGTFSYTRRNPVSNATGLSYRYEYSVSLADDWTPVPAGFGESSDGGNPVETVTVTLPAGLLANPTLFVRVVAE